MKTIEQLNKIRVEKRIELDLRKNTNADTREKHILVCNSTGCTSSKSPQILDNLLFLYIFDIILLFCSFFITFLYFVIIYLNLSLLFLLMQYNDLNLLFFHLMMLYEYYL